MIVVDRELVEELAGQFEIFQDGALDLYSVGRVAVLGRLLAGNGETGAHSHQLRQDALGLGSLQRFKIDGRGLLRREDRGPHSGREVSLAVALDCVLAQPVPAGEHTHRDAMGEADLDPRAMVAGADGAMSGGTAGGHKGSHSSPHSTKSPITTESRCALTLSRQHRLANLRWLEHPHATQLTY